MLFGVTLKMRWGDSGKISNVVINFGTSDDDDDDDDNVEKKNNHLCSVYSLIVPKTYFEPYL